MKKTLTLCFLLGMSTLLFSQVIITGRVTDESGVGLPGANVYVKGTTVGAVTNMDGDFQISINDASSDILVFSFIGYTTAEIPVQNRTRIDVTLNPEIEEMEEVVVTALGITREAKSLPYARQSVSSEELTEARSTNFVTSLAGKAAGVQVISSDTPSGSNRVVIRGNSSLTGNNQPLYVIDGIPLDNEQGDAKVSVWNSGEDIDYGNPISQINPDDIANIEILKGPNAAALYGSRAANGVILITTKTGTTTEGLGVIINSNTMFISNIQYPDYQYIYGEGSSMRMSSSAYFDEETGYPFVGMYYRAYGAPLLGQDIIDYNKKIGKYIPYPNNIKELYTTGVNLSNSVSIDKATENTSVRVSYTNVNSTFTIKDWEVQKRHNLSLRASTILSKKLQVDANIMYTFDKVNNRLYKNGSDRNPAYQYIYQLPNMSTANLTPYKDENGKAFLYPHDFHNPLWNIYENSNQDLSNRIIGSVSLSYSIIENLRLRGKAMGDINLTNGSEFNNWGASYDPDGYYKTFGKQTFNFNYESLLTYDRTFGEVSVIATLGGNIFEYSKASSDSRISALLLPGVQSLSNSAGVPTVNQSNFRKRIHSVFGSTSVGYRGLVYLDVTARNDWSSTLPKDNNSYFYPSIGTSIIVSELLPENEILSFAKLRVSYAQVGNDADPYQVLTNYNYGGIYNGIAWTYQDRTKNNKNLKPELTSSLEFGLETILLNNRISLNATYYNASTINQIVRADVTPVTGFTSQVFNAGEIENKGWELIIGGRPVIGKFSWSIDANWSTNKSMVVSLIEGVDRFLLRLWHNVGVYAEVGEPFGVIRGNAGLKDADGNYLVKEANGRVLRNTDVILGNAAPDWLAGLRNSFTYKGFDLSFLFDFRYGGDVFAETMNKNSNRGVSAQTLYGRDDYYFSSIILGESDNERKGVGLYGHDYTDDRPKGAIYEGAYIGVLDEETGEYVAGEPNNIYISPQEYFYDMDEDDQTRLTYDASFVKLREVILGYNLPAGIMSNIPIDGIRISLVGRNLAILHQNTPKGIDPEAGTTSGNGQGIEFGSFLPTRTYGFNIKLSF